MILKSAFEICPSTDPRSRVVKKRKEKKKMECECVICRRRPTGDASLHNQPDFGCTLLRGETTFFATFPSAQP